MSDVTCIELTKHEVDQGVQEGHAWFSQGPAGAYCVTVVFYMQDGAVRYGCWASERGLNYSLKTVIRRARQVALGRQTRRATRESFEAALNA